MTDLVEIAAREIFFDQFGGTSDPVLTRQFEEHCRSTAEIVISALREAGALREEDWSEFSPLNQCCNALGVALAYIGRVKFSARDSALIDDCRAVHEKTKAALGQPLTQPSEER